MGRGVLEMWSHVASEVCKVKGKKAKASVKAKAAPKVKTEPQVVH